MKHKRILFLGVGVLGVISLGACSKNDASTTTTIASPQTTTLAPTTTTTTVVPTTTPTPLPTTTSTTPVKETYTEKDIKVYYASSNENHKIRLYHDSADIPYLGIKDYYKLLLKNSNLSTYSNLSITTTDNINYTITTPTGGILKANINDNTILSNNYSYFNNTSSFIVNQEVTTYDGSPWIKIESTTSLELSHPKFIDFDNYGIDIHGDDTDVYFPIQTLGDMFTGMNMIFSGYNNKDLYIIDGEKREDLFTLFPSYNEEIFKTQLSQALMDYSYNELCFFYDNLAGRPGRTALENYFDLTKGLDAALEANTLGKKIKSYLKSNDIAEYLTGFTLFGIVARDGGHTSVDYQYALYSNTQSNFAEWATDSVINKFYGLMNEEVQKNYSEIQYAKSNNLNYDRSEVRKKRQAALNKDSELLVGTNAYSEKGDTAMIHLDNFINDIENMEEWKKYYSGERNDIPYSDTMGGTVAVTFKGLERARNNPNVKHVVIDIGANNGGSSDELVYLISLLSKKENRNELYFRNQLNNQLVKTTYKLDRNLDGKFDATDDTYDPIGDLNVFVLTSPFSFSCGGISPVYLHDNGLKVVGDISGGGSCAVINRTNGIGIFERFAAPYNILSPNRKAGIDYERFYVCDYKIDLPQVGNPPQNDYSKYYDLDYLSTLATQLFS